MRTCMQWQKRKKMIGLSRITLLATQRTRKAPWSVYERILLSTRTVQNVQQGTTSTNSPAIGDTVLSFKNVTYEYKPMQPLLKNISFNIKEGSKVTIMGQNGSGKSTILRLMHGILKPQDGSINIKRSFALSTPLQVISPADRSRTLREFFIHYLHGNVAGLDSRITKALQEVQLTTPDVNMDRIVGTFSGGQQARLLLASTLILEPDILLLDEPTNNLDVRGIEVLKNIIRNTTKTCVVISHDEEFLNSFSDAVLYIDSKKHCVEQYEGNYLRVKQEIAKRIERENIENARLIREAKAKKEQATAFAGKGGANVRKAAKKLREQAEALEEDKIAVRREDRSLREFSIPLQGTAEELQRQREIEREGNFKKSASVESAGTKMMTIAYIDLPNGRRLDYSKVPMLLETGAKLRIKGANGIGKTTFLEGIINGSAAAAGVTVNSRARIGYYRQDFRNLDYSATVLDSLRRASNAKHPEVVIRNTAAAFLLRGEIVHQQVQTLSEGQKALLSLACLVLTEPSILIVDEPTNHINFRHLPAIAHALDNFKGILILVSHDHEFASRINFTKVIDLGA